MSQRPLPCPDEDLLLGFTEGRLDGAVQEGVVQHLSQCDICLAAVGGVGHAATSSTAALETSSATWSSTPKGSSPGPHRAATAFQAGDVVAGRYEIRRFIDRGGMGEVYEAADGLLGVRVALKTVVLEAGDNPRGIEQIRREVQVARAINHPGVCRVFDLGEHVVEGSAGSRGRRFFLTMEFLDGVTLGRRIRTGGALGSDVLVPIARQLAEGLAAAHDAGVVHRDFKSDNVMLVPPAHDGVSRAVVMDFGLARGAPTGASLASTGGLMVGSAAYMAPEQVMGGPVREAADIYAFGVVLFEASTGRLPFMAATPMATATKRLFEDPPAPRRLASTISPGLEHIILRCLAREPGDRFASVRDVSRALAEIEIPRSSGAEGFARPVRSRLSRPALWVMAASALAISVTVFAEIEARRSARQPQVAQPAPTLQSPRPSGPQAQPAGGGRTGGPDPWGLATRTTAESALTPPVRSRARDRGTQAPSGQNEKKVTLAVGRGAPVRIGSAEVSQSDLPQKSAGATSPPSTDDHAQKPKSQSPLDGFENPFQ